MKYIIPDNITTKIYIHDDKDDVLYLEWFDQHMESRNKIFLNEDFYKS